ncbi:succinyldiaminopimelate transaminase [Dermacoccaceae bacterium W4C1]
MSRRLPDFPWDTIAGAKAKAASHPGGIVDLSVGTPVDPTPQLLQEALAGASDAPGYPQTYGTPELRQAVADWFARRRAASAVDPDGVMPTIGSKELVAWLPTLLDLGSDDAVAFPSVAYPTYDVGARIAGAHPVPADGVATLTQVSPKLVWLNTPSNPTGAVASVEELRAVVDWARERGVVVASDECYAELDWRTDADGPTTPSILDDRVTGGSHEGLLAVYSLSKQSNLAGYRAAFVAGDPALVRALLEVRKHAGMIVPAPVQRVLTVALGDDEHVAAQKARYAHRRSVLRSALEDSGWRIEASEAGLYLWTTRGESSRDSLDRLAESGILVAPGDFYGTAGAQHVRIALTATDERIEEAAQRLRG